MNIDELKTKICSHYLINPKDLLSDRRLKNIVMAKKVFWKVLYLNGKSTSQIGMITNKDHSTIVVGIKNLSKFPKDNDYAIRLYMEFRDEPELNRNVDYKRYVEIIREKIRKKINNGESLKEISSDLKLSERYVEKTINQIKSGLYKKVPDYKHGTYRTIYL